jgi:hypothetical protein
MGWVVVSPPCRVGKINDVIPASGKALRRPHPPLQVGSNELIVANLLSRVKVKEVTTTLIEVVRS